MQVRTAYGVSGIKFAGISGDGTGQTIAIVVAYDYPNAAADLSVFSTTMGLPSVPAFARVSQRGNTNDLPATIDATWAGEASLDVQWAHAVAPGASILLVEADTKDWTNLISAVDVARNWPGVSVVSMSWSTAEFQGESTWESHFTTPAGHSNVTFLAASGDYGEYSGQGSSAVLVQYPAASANVVGVGGTVLTLSASGGYGSESGWGNGTSSNTWGGSGGGNSVLISSPSYQAGVAPTGYRAVPDVSMVGGSLVAVYNSTVNGASQGWYGQGLEGTSAAAPMWAGVIAFADQGRALNGLPTLDGPSQTLPLLCSLPQSDFHDITTGNNGYAAGMGYDLVTGRGTPIADVLCGALAQTPAGHVDVADSLHVSGWAYDPSDGASSTTVTLTLDGQPFGGTHTGSGARPDIAGQTIQGSVVNGANHGYTLNFHDIPGGMTAGTHTLNVYATPSGSGGQSVLLGSQSVSDRAPIGSLDVATCLSVVGWAYDADAGSTSTYVALYVDGQYKGNLLAANNRPDLQSYLGSSNHGYEISLANMGLIVGTHQVQVYALDYNGQAHASLGVRGVEDHAPIGSLDICNAQNAIGWAFDSDSGATAISVALYIDNSWRANVVANAYRPNLQSYLGSSYHGYVISLTPYNMSVGNHLISVFALDSNNTYTNPLIGQATITV